MKEPQVPKLRRIRQERAWSIDHLVYFSGVPSRRISLIERGLATTIKPEEKERLAEALGWPIEDLFSPEEVFHDSQ